MHSLFTTVIDLYIALKICGIILCQFCISHGLTFASNYITTVYPVDYFPLLILMRNVFGQGWLLFLHVHGFVQWFGTNCV